MGQALSDGLDFALTFIPGSALGAGGRALARTAAMDMAAGRTAMRQGGKEAAQAAERSAARTEAKSVAESQAAQARASLTAKPINARKQFRNKKGSSDHEQTLSGWSSDRPVGFHVPNDQEVLRATDEMGTLGDRWDAEIMELRGGLWYLIQNAKKRSSPRNPELEFLILCVKTVPDGFAVTLNILAKLGTSPTRMGLGFLGQTVQCECRPVQSFLLGRKFRESFGTKEGAER